MKYLYVRPSLETTGSLFLHVFAQSGALALNKCAGIGDPPCANQGDTVQQQSLYCLEGSNDPTVLNDASDVLLFPQNVVEPNMDCPNSVAISVSGCHEDSGYQSECNQYGGGLPVVCTTQIPCIIVFCDAFDDSEALSTRSGQISCACRGGAGTNDCCVPGQSPDDPGGCNTV